MSGRMLCRPPGLQVDLNGVVRALAIDEAVATFEGWGFVSVAAKAAFLHGERGPEWLDERDIPGRFVAVDRELVANGAWTSSTRVIGSVGERG